MSGPLVIAVPAKGRLQENAESFFARAGLPLMKPRGAREYRGTIAGFDSIEVAYLCGIMARELGLDEHEETTILLGAYLHDLGKIGVPPDVLHKPGSLTPEERAIVQMHPVWGISLLADVEFPWDIKPIIRWRHGDLRARARRARHRIRADGLRAPRASPAGALEDAAIARRNASTTRSDHQCRLPVIRSSARSTGNAAWWPQSVVSASNTSAMPTICAEIGMASPRNPSG